MTGANEMYTVKNSNRNSVLFPKTIFDRTDQRDIEEDIYLNFENF